MSKVTVTYNDGSVIEHFTDEDPVVYLVAHFGVNSEEEIASVAGASFVLVAAPEPVVESVPEPVVESTPVEEPTNE